MKAWLSRAGLEFAVKNVDEDDRAYDELLALGLRTIPATRIGTTVITGFDPAGLLAALAGEQRGTGNEER